jgi:hypothetical protein
MTYDVNKALKSYHNIQQMLNGIPAQLWDIFLPDNEEDLSRLETSILSFRARAEERNKVIAMQRLLGFPLRPNESLRKTQIRARIAGMQKDKLRKKRNNRRDDSGDAIN